jgi:hypothetical protein
MGVGAKEVGADDDDDDVYLRLQHGKGFHNFVYVFRKTQKTIQKA